MLGDTQVTRVVVIGGGIVGASTAYMLSREGVAVTLVEAREIGGGATAAGMGHIVVMNESPAEFAFTKYARALWDELARDIEGDFDYTKTGTLWVAVDEEEMAHVRPLCSFYMANGVEAELLDAWQVAEAEPQLRRDVVGALRVPGDAVVFAPAAAKRLAQFAELVSGRVVGLAENEVALANGGVLHADAIVCANGFEAKDFFPNLALRPRKGHLALAVGYEGFVAHDLIELGYLKSAHGDAQESVAFNVQPRTEGRLLLGSSRQYGVTDPAIEEHMMAKMLARVTEYLPALHSPQIERTWTGFRAATPDKLPYIGLAPGMTSVYLATGHEGLGITGALATGALLRDQILRRPCAIDPGPYLPNRKL